MKLSRANRGFTVSELLTATVIIGIILLLIGYEFDHTLEHLLHTRQNRDAESGARLAMSKVTDRLRGASPWVFVPTGGPAPTPDPDLVIKNPVPVSTPGATSNVLQFYRVRPGSLANPAAIPTSGPGQAPNPSYDLVTIQRGTNPCNPGCGDPSPNYLVETAVDAQSGAQSEVPVVLGSNVTNFSVTGTGSPDAAAMDISLTVTATDSRCEPNCAYTAASSVYVGGASVLNQ
ncbi:MAG: prepilin-type N-terminal cleavage/methylation domain-containing protein [Candidatus Eremiobacteraeota bacterium]|nr:prepilin-type N-terminal cleavage/methylation domain-containing protein [Candidatus Eremiobacteraeota bacterium]